MSVQKIFALVGKWEHDPSGQDMGFDVFSYDSETGSLRFLRSAAPEVTVGQTYYDGSRNVLYVADEIEKAPGSEITSGRVYAFQVDTDRGTLTQLNHKLSLGARTSYVTTDAESRYLICTNHSTRKSISTVTRDTDGTYRMTVLYDDANTVLFPLNDDGSICDAIDVFRHTELGKQNNPHPHCVVRSPSGNLFFVNDKGGDRIYSFGIEQDHLVRKNTMLTEFGSSPRYGVFHPTRPYYFLNNEGTSYITAYQYDEAGTLKEINRASIVPEGYQEEGRGLQRRAYQSSDLCISADGSYLYNIVRRMNSVCVYAISPETGALARIQCIEIPSEYAGDLDIRGCCISPDGKYLLIALFATGDIAAMEISAEGTLRYAGIKNDRKVKNAANITFVER